MSSPRAILHADLDAFYASVEQRDDPALAGRPVIVGGGVVLAASYEARAAGVRGGMGGARAYRLCPDAIVVPPRWSAYVEASRAVRAVFEAAAPEVEPVSIDEAFLDVTGLDRLGRSPSAIGRALRLDVRREVGLPLSVGGASTRMLAKIACGAGKPDGLLALAPDDELPFLRARPVGAVPGIGPATVERLDAHGIRTVADIAAWSEEVLVAWFGGHGGRRLHAVAHNLDRTPVRSGRRRRSFGAQAAMGRGPHGSAAIDARLVGLADRVTRRMRTAGRAGRTITVRVRLGDYTAITRARTLPLRTAESAVVLAVARALLAEERALLRRRGVTLVGIAVSALEADDAPLQLALPLDGEEAAGTVRDPRAVDTAVDAVLERFGSGSVTRGVLVGSPGSEGSWPDPDERGPDRG
ncbi:DNA polymerase IV [Patulibacter minatonensis]|uniref:DNA polymerase IV n=1 Tax=Patulibacter minatonensis TaxID=298163 RepID=UPI000684B79C|nr:DNA polymerase IV [Patulibacter minatonensis]